MRTFQKLEYEITKEAREASYGKLLRLINLGYIINPFLKNNQVMSEMLVHEYINTAKLGLLRVGGSLGELENLIEDGDAQKIMQFRLDYYHQTKDILLNNPPVDDKTLDILSVAAEQEEKENGLIRTLHFYSLIETAGQEAEGLEAEKIINEFSAAESLGLINDYYRNKFVKALVNEEMNKVEEIRDKYLNRIRKGVMDERANA